MLAMDHMKKFIRPMAERIARPLAGLVRDQRGVSAVEFAMLLPLMLTLYLGAVEISQGIGADRKVTLTARTTADLASQASGLSSSDMTNSLNAASAVMAPYSTTNLKVTVSQVSIDANSKATISWSATLNGTARAKGLSNFNVLVRHALKNALRIGRGTVAKLAMRQPFVLFKGLTFQKLCLPGAFRPGDHHNKMLRPGLCVVHASPQYL